MFIPFKYLESIDSIGNPSLVESFPRRETGLFEESSIRKVPNHEFLLIAAPKYIIIWNHVRRICCSLFTTEPWKIGQVSTKLVANILQIYCAPIFDPYAKDVVLVGNRRECCYIIYLSLRLWLFCVGDPSVYSLNSRNSTTISQILCAYYKHMGMYTHVRSIFYICLHHALMKLNIMVFLQTLKHITHMIHKTVQWNHIPHWTVIENLQEIPRV